VCYFLGLPECYSVSDIFATLFRHHNVDEFNPFDDFPSFLDPMFTDREKNGLAYYAVQQIDIVFHLAMCSPPLLATDLLSETVLKELGHRIARHFMFPFDIMWSPDFVRWKVGDPVLDQPSWAESAKIVEKPVLVLQAENDDPVNPVPSADSFMEVEDVVVSAPQQDQAKPVLAVGQPVVEVPEPEVVLEPPRQDGHQRQILIDPIGPGYRVVSNRVLRLVKSFADESSAYIPTLSQNLHFRYNYFYAKYRFAATKVAGYLARRRFNHMMWFVKSRLFNFIVGPSPGQRWKHVWATRVGTKQQYTTIYNPYDMIWCTRSGSVTVGDV